MENNRDKNGRTIVLTGGGTAGHVTPNMALIPHLKNIGFTNIHYVGTNGIEKELISGIEGVTFHEIPAGKLEAFDTNPLEAARRELLEETGVTAESIVHLGQYIPSPAILSEVIQVYLARGLTYGETCPDEDEFLEVERIPLGRLVDMIMANEISDGKTVFGILKTKLFLEREGGNG